MSEQARPSLPISWTKKLEAYFASTGEKAHCLSWAHKKSEGLYSTRRTWIDLPVIVLSGVTGFLSAGSTTMFAGKETEASIALGVVSLFVGLLNTVGTYFGWAKRAEAHRISSLHYAKLFRYISVEMALPRDERMAPNDLLKSVRDQYERLNETSPMLSPLIVDMFKSVVAKSADHKSISVPDEMNGLEAIYVYDPNDLKDDLELNNKVQELHDKLGNDALSASLPPLPIDVAGELSGGNHARVSALNPLPMSRKPSILPRSESRKPSVQHELEAAPESRDAVGSSVISIYAPEPIAETDESESNQTEDQNRASTS